MNDLLSYAKQLMVFGVILCICVAGIKPSIAKYAVNNQSETIVVAKAEKIKSANIALPDLSTHPGIEVGGLHVNWGQTIILDAGSATGTHEGMCVFPYKVDIWNLGTAHTGAFQYRLKSGPWSILEGHPGIAAGGFTQAQGHIGLKPGKQKVLIGLDNMNQIAELNENNNIPQAVTVKLKGNCLSVKPYFKGKSSKKAKFFSKFK